jgi:hypothetical protein
VIIEDATGRSIAVINRSIQIENRTRDDSCRLLSWCRRLLMKGGETPQARPVCRVQASRSGRRDPRNGGNREGPPIEKHVWLALIAAISVKPQFSIKDACLR